MAQVLINDTTLEALGDAIREKKGEDKNLYNYWINKTLTADDFTSYGIKLVVPVDQIDNLTTLNINCSVDFQVSIIYRRNTTSYGWYVKPSKSQISLTDNDLQIIRENYDNIYIKPYSVSYTFNIGDTIQIWDNTIVGLNPETNYTPTEMVDEVNNLFVAPLRLLNITGDATNFFASGNNRWVLEDYSDRITTYDLTNIGGMFQNNSYLTEIPFDINCKMDFYSSISLSNIFVSSNNLLKYPKIKLNILGLFNNFYDGKHYKSVNFTDDVEFNDIQANISPYGLFNNMSYLKNYGDLSFLKIVRDKQTSTSWNSYPYYNMFNNCYCLNKIEDLLVPKPNLNADMYSTNFSYFVYNCHNLSKFTFETNEDGSPIVCNFKGAILDFSSTGLCDRDLSSLNFDRAYNVGWNDDANRTFTVAEKDLMMAKYNRLKNTDNWWFFNNNIGNWLGNGLSVKANILICKYNRLSAIETINSLPDTSAYGTNTIKFKRGNYGQLTDGGSIDTMTPDEIAVATAKGWTVTFA